MATKGIKIILGVVILGLFFVIYKLSFATTLSSQLINSNLFQSCLTQYGADCISTTPDHGSQEIIPLAGTLDKITFNAKSVTGTFIDVTIYKIVGTSYNLVGYFSPSNYVAGKTDGNGVMTSYTLMGSDFSSTITFDGTSSYSLQIFAYHIPPCSFIGCYNLGYFLGDYSYHIGYTMTDSSGGTLNPTETRLIHETPASGSVTTSSTFDLKYKYYVNSNTDPQLNKILITACPKSYTIDDCIVIDQNVTANNDLYENTVSLTTTKDGLYHVDIALWNGKNTVHCAWYQFTCISTVAVYGPQDVWEFSVNTASGTGGVPPVVNDSTFYAPLSPSTCAIATFDAMPCLISVTRYLFVPSIASIDQFKNLYNSIRLKPPVGYIVAVQASLSSLNNTDTPTLTLESMTTISDNIFTPLKTGLEWVLWVAFGIFLLKRFRHFEI